MVEVTSLPLPLFYHIFTYGGYKQIQNVSFSKVAVSALLKKEYRITPFRYIGDGKSFKYSTLSWERACKLSYKIVKNPQKIENGYGNFFH
jgi:hypothetical protein